MGIELQKNTEVTLSATTVDCFILLIYAFSDSSFYTCVMSNSPLVYKHS